MPPPPSLQANLMEEFSRLRFPLLGISRFVHLDENQPAQGPYPASPENKKIEAGLDRTLYLQSFCIVFLTWAIKGPTPFGEPCCTFSFSGQPEQACSPVHRTSGHLSPRKTPTRTTEMTLITPGPSYQKKLPPRQLFCIERSCPIPT